MTESESMACPRCSIGTIEPDENRCALCGFSPGDGVVTAEQPEAERLKNQLEEELGDRFELLRPLGFTDRSLVYVARDPDQAEDVALKIVPLNGPLDPGLMAQFERNASRVRLITHPQLAHLFGFGVTQSLVWYTREYGEGLSLHEHLRRSGPFPVKAAVKLISELAGVLHYLHAQGLVHGSVRSSNVLLDGFRLSKLCDAAMGPSLTRIRVLSHGAVSLHTSEYLAPEEFGARALTPSSDQYALAVVAYETLTGLHPFVGDSPEEMEALHREEIPKRLRELRPEIPESIDRAVARALAKRPTSRFPDVLQFAQALRGEDVAPAFGRVSGTPTAPRTRTMVVLAREFDSVKERNRALRGAPRQRELYEVIQAGGGAIPVERVRKEFGFSPNVLSRLEKRGLVRIEEQADPKVVEEPRQTQTDIPVLFVEPESQPFVTPPRIGIGVAGLVVVSVLALLLRGLLDTPEPPVMVSLDPAPAVSMTDDPVQVRPDSPMPESMIPVLDSVTDVIGQDESPEPVSDGVGERETPTVAVPAPTPRPVPSSPGRLFVNSNPWGLVYLDGELLGNTPRVNVPVTPGRHVLRIVRVGYAPYEEEIVVGSGEELRMTQIVLEPQ